MRLLGLEKYTATRVGDLEFDYRVFGRTAERAWRGRPAQMRPKSSETAVTV
ncbi:MAG TPA: hypothetical protein VIT23_11340 [Terrimicrobiaceae bacterium]